MKKLKVEIGDYILLILLTLFVANWILIGYGRSDLNPMLQPIQDFLYFFHIIPLGFVFFTIATGIIYLFWIIMNRKSILKTIFPIVMIMLAGVWLNALLKY